MRLALLLIPALLLVPSGKANLINYSATGVFGASVPNSSFTPAPPATRTWSVAFSADDGSAVALDLHTFAVTPIHFVYTVNSVDLGLTPSNIYFYDSANWGMFTIEFDADDALSFSGPVLFSGDVSDPTLLKGTFVDDGVGGSVDGVFVGNTNFQSLNGVVLLAAPEPAPAALVAFGTFALVGWRRLRGRPRQTQCKPASRAA